MLLLWLLTSPINGLLFCQEEPLCTTTVPRIQSRLQRMFSKEEYGRVKSGRIHAQAYHIPKDCYGTHGTYAVMRVYKPPEVGGVGVRCRVGVSTAQAVSCGLKTCQSWKSMP